MAGVETNVFPIVNVAELSTSYKLYRIRGLGPDQSEYYQNVGYLKRTLSYRLRKPVTVIERDRKPILVVRDDADDPPSRFPLVRTAVVFERIPGTVALDYTVRSPENDEICLRFLQFMVQEPLFADQALWQPGSGRPFFEKNPTELTVDSARHIGFSVRAVVTPEGGLGFCVDVTHKTVSRSALPTHLSRDDFSQWKGRHCVYHWGHQWYEIQIIGLSDLNVLEHLVPKDGEWIPLLECIVQESAKPIPPELAQVVHDASVVLYKNNRGEDRAAPAPLCYPVQRTDDEETGERHSGTILPPYSRRGMIRDFVRRYLTSLRFGDVRVRVSREPAAVLPRMFSVPDCEFGSGQVLSARSTPGTHHVSLDNLGSERLSLLKRKDAGFFCKDTLDRQYFVIPLSVHESYGIRFLDDLRRSVGELFPQEGGYDPVIVTYNDRGPRTFPYQGTAILRAVQAECTRPGYGVVMIHRTVERRLREEDQLAAMIVRELRERFDLCVAVIHTDVGQECYELVRQGRGDLCYRPRRDKHGRLMGYLRNVAMNKVLLTNQRWPFVLKTPLNADIVVGMDVKHHTAGLMVVGGNGSEIRTLLKTSKQAERLLREQTQAYLVEIIRKEAETRSELVRTMVIHRDGRLHQSEREGAEDAAELLRVQGIVDPSATLTMLEISKTSPAPLRLFDVSHRNGREWVENPQVGYYYMLDEHEGYLCTTGRAFPRPGTVRPLHVRRIEGPLPLEKCLEDVYYLTVLAWTRPEDCTRTPITSKLNDRFLGEEATDYDEDVLDYALILGEETDE